MSVVSLVVFWSVTPVLAQSVGQPSHPVPQELITVSLPVYVTSLISTAIFTWVVAKYQTSRDKQVSDLQSQVKALTLILEKRHPQDHDILSQKGFGS